MIAMITPPIEFYADQLHDAMSGPGTNEDVLIEFMTTCSNSDIKAIRKVYERSKGHMRFRSVHLLLYLALLFIF